MFGKEELNILLLCSGLIKDTEESLNEDLIQEYFKKRIKEKEDFKNNEKGL